MNCFKKSNKRKKPYSREKIENSTRWMTSYFSKWREKIYVTWNEVSCGSTCSLKAFEAYSACSQQLISITPLKKLLKKNANTVVIATWNCTALECPFSDTDARGDDSSSDPSRTGDGGWGGAT